MDNLDQRKEMTFGQKTVGATFNPSGNEKVNRLKQLLAEAIDIVVDDASPRMNPADYDLYARGAVDNLINAQMRAVKSVTFKGEQ